MTSTLPLVEAPGDETAAAPARKVSRVTEKARKELARGLARAEEWDTRAREARAAQQDAEAKLGEATLAADDPAVAARGLSDARDQATAAESAAGAAHAACRPLERAALLAEARDERAAHGKLVADAERHHARTQELLARLVEHERGGEWVCVWGRLGRAEYGPRTTQLREEAETSLARALDLERRAAELEPAA